MAATRQLAATMLSIAAAIASAMPAALAGAILAATLAATLAAPAFADHDGVDANGNPVCPAGQSIPKGVTSGCVDDSTLEFWDWCYASMRRNNSGNVCQQRTHSDCSVFLYTGTTFYDGESDVWYCTNNGASECPDHQAYDPDTHACADSAPTAAPVITRPVSADWKNETFVVYWRPGTGGEAQNITGYRITREQVAVTATAHPSVCDTANYPAGTNSIDIAVTATAQVYKYTNNARGQNGELGVTHGNCYRWKIAAINAQGTGPEAITHPILSRGYVHDNEVFAYDDTSDNAGVECPAGRSRPYAYNANNWGTVCYPDAFVDRADRCNSLRAEADIGGATRYDEPTNICRVDYTANTEDDPTVCTSRGFDFVEAALNREYCRIPPQCGDLSEYNLNHRECHCEGWAQPASGASAASPNACECNVEGADPSTCLCPADKPYVPAENSCGCPAGEIFNAATSYCILNPLTGDLAAEVTLANPSLVSVRALLAAGADANGLVNEIRFVLTAAANGHAALVSILITAGADPTARHPTWHGANIPHLMAAWDSPVKNLSTARRRDVLFHFGNAVVIRNVDFDYNALTGNGNHMVALLSAYTAPARPGGNEPDRSQALEMTDYMLGHGMNCSHLSGDAIYGEHCVGGLGKALVGMVNKDDGTRETSAIHRLFSAGEIQNAARAVVNAGIPITILGNIPLQGQPRDRGGHLIGVAAYNGQYNALSVLLTFGMDPKGRTFPARSVLGYVGRFSGTAGDAGGDPERVINGIERGPAVHYDPLRALRVLQYYIGGLRAAGVLSSFDGWNEPTTGYSGRRALENFDVYASDHGGFVAEKTEIHALLYENGARCSGDSSRTSAAARYCELPVRAVVGRGEIPWTTGVGVLTVTARAGSRFQSPPVTTAVLSSLTSAGWTLAVETGPEPDELVLSRSRRPQGNPPVVDAAAVFTVTLFRGTEAIQAVPVSAELADNENLALLIQAALSGDATETGRLAALLGESIVRDAADENGVPLILGAARLGHAAVVSVLITAGADPDARLTSFYDVNVAHLMAARDGAEQADGSQLSRAARWEVLRHFGDAVSVKGASFDWNALDGNSSHVGDLLNASDDVASAGDKVILLEMADYMLARGMHCLHESDFRQQYREFCYGTRGVVLVSLIARPAEEPAAEVSEILAAAAAMTAAGVSVTLAGSETEGGLAALAAARLRGPALSVLVTLGFDPEGTNAQGRTPAHVIAFGAETTAPMMLTVLRHFIGGLDAAGKLLSFAGWQTAGPGSAGLPLESFNERATANNLHAEAKAEMHALFFEAGAYCTAPVGTRPYCMVPATYHHPIASEGLPGGAVYTITARAFAKFDIHSGGGFGEGATLAALGWTLALDAEVAVLSRTRRATDEESRTVSFTLTMTTGGGLAVHYARVDAEVVPNAYAGLLSAVVRGDAAGTERWMNTLISDHGTEYVNVGDASGVPLVVVAAALGHAAVVSVLLTFGFDPNARHPSWDNGAVPHMMGRFDGPDIPWAARVSVLRSFGGAISVRATLFDWNATDDNGDRMLDLLLAAARRDSEGANAEPMGEAADYALARGARCESATAADRAHFACSGALGAALAAVINRLSAPVVESENAEVRTAAQAMVNAGVSISLAYSASGHLVAQAAARRHGGALSVLITFGMDPKGRTTDNRSALHHVGRGSDSSASAAQMLDVARHFIGGLSVAGKLEGFDGWNDASDIGRPLEALNSFAQFRSREDHLSPEREIQSLMYERGARCGGGGNYCDVPVERAEAPARLSGPVLTITARTVAGAEFSDPLLAPAARAALDDNGWTTDLNTSADPDRVVFSAQGAELTVALTISLEVNQTIIREYRVSPRPVVEYAAVPADGSGGTLTANVANGGRANTGDEVVFTALPAENFFVDEWRGDATCAARETECAVTVEGNVSVVASFSRDCTRESRLQVSPTECGACLNSTYQLDEENDVCRSRPSLRYAAEPPIGGAGTLTASAMLITSPDRAGVFVAVGATITFTATPGAGHFVAEWRGEGGQCSGSRGVPAQSGPVDGLQECEVAVTLNAQTQMAEDLNVVAVFRQATRNCPAESRAADNGGAHLCGDCLPGHSELRGLCLPESGHYDEDEFSERDVCLLLGGRFATNEAFCADADESGTFCILDATGTDPAFPCRGLFRRVLHCNLAHDRPGVNPFTCGERCDEGQIAQGGACRDN